MTTFVVNTRTAVFPSATPPANADGLPVLERGDRFTGAVAAGAVRKTDDPAGFVDVHDVEEAPDKIRPFDSDSDRIAFCRTATNAARAFKADRNYLLATAFFLSKNLSDFGTPTAARIGPFAMTSREWCDGMDLVNGATPSLMPIHMLDPISQATVEAKRVAKSMADFPGGEPPLPVELFFFQRLGADATKLLKLDPAQPCSKAFTTLPPAGSYASDIAAKPSGEVIKAVSDGLMAGYAEAIKSVNVLPPHLRFFSDEDFAPWVTVARLLKGKNMKTSPDTLARQFMSFSPEVGTRSAVFVGFCLAFCGVKEAKDKVPPTGLGSVATWKKWPSEDARAPDPAPVGAIVVTTTARVGILAAPPQGDTLKVYFCSDGNDIEVKIESLPRNQVDTLRWLDLAGGDATDGTLGALSKKYESGKGGPGTVSHGSGDAGGVSYGTYQFATRTGSAAAFVNSLPAILRDRFAGLAAGTEAFSDVWRKIATEDAAGFDRLQHAHIKKNFYDPLVSAVKNQTGIDVNGRSRALQDCCWSSGVQHGAGGGTSIVVGVIARLLAAGTPKPDDGKPFDKAALEGVYGERGRKNADGRTLVHFSNNSQSVQDGVAARFVAELADALRMLAA